MALLDGPNDGNGPDGDSKGGKSPGWAPVSQKKTILFLPGIICKFFDNFKCIFAWKFIQK